MPLIAGLLGVILSPFAYLYVERPVLFGTSLLIGLFLVPASLHYPWIWVIYSGSIALHTTYLARRHASLKTPSWYASPIGLMLCLLMLTASGAGVRVLLLDIYRVSSGSMQPNLEINDLAIVKKWEDVEIQRGLIYTFRFKNDDAIYIKRLVGVPGDAITMRGNHLTLNGTEITALDPSGGDLWEELSDSRYRIFDLYDIKKFRRDWILKEGEYFFLGDNRSNSIDSRIKGPVTLPNIIGKADKLFYF